MENSLSLSLNDIEERMGKCIALGHTNPNAFANMEHFLREDIADVSREIYRLTDSVSAKTKERLRERTNALESRRKSVFTDWYRRPKNHQEYE